MDLAKTRKNLRETFLGWLLLLLSSWIYSVIVFLRRLAYGVGLLRSKKLSVKTICIGNITTGGTGKTSAVLLAAHTLHKHNIKTAILSRGYRRPTPSREITVLLNTQNVSWRKTGDEPWMMHHALNGMDIPILISPNRFRAGVEAINYYDSKTILLDDGFQHLKLRRDVDIILVNANDPFGGNHMLPLGDLREPLSALRRASMVVITHSDQIPPDDLDKIKETIHKVKANIPILEAVHRPDFLLDLRTEEKLKPSHLKDKKISSFCGIGDPASFEYQLKQLGGNLAQCWRFPDHHHFSENELKSIDNVRAGMPLVTTFKDAVRLPADWTKTLSGEVLVLGIKMEITKGEKIWEKELCN